MNEQTKNAQRAITRGELFAYLIGAKEYAYQNPYADMPTYPSDVFASLVDYYQQSKDVRVWHLFKECLVQLSTDKNYAWLSPYYLVVYMRYIIRESSSNVSDLEYLAKIICENLIKLKESLLHDKRWDGQNYSTGLWGDVQRMIHNINEEFDLNLVV